MRYLCQSVILRTVLNLTSIAAELTEILDLPHPVLTEQRAQPGICLFTLDSG